MFDRVVPKQDPIDPTLFAVDWAMVAEVLALVVVLAFFLERALALLFESRWFLLLEKARDERGQGSFKPLIALAGGALICIVWQLDAVSILMHSDNMTWLGAIVTGAIIAGGSKASIKLFHDVLGVKSSAYDRIKGEQSTDSGKDGKDERKRKDDDQ